MSEAVYSVLLEKLIEFILSNALSFVFLVTFWTWIKNNKILSGVLILVLTTSSYAFYEYKKPKIYFKYNGIKISDEILQNLSFEFNDELCVKDTENKELVFICDEPFTIPSTYYYKFNNKKKDIYIDANSLLKPILFNDDPNQYVIKHNESSLTVEKGIIKGALFLIDKNNGKTKFKTIEKKEFQLCETNLIGKINNSVLYFETKMSQFSNAYYNNCKKTADFVIDGEDYKYKKNFFLLDTLDPKNLFPSIQCDSNGTNINTEELNQCNNDYMSIKDNKLIITSNSTEKIPNINLFNLPINESNNSYLKFTLDDLNEDTSLNFFVSGQQIFRFNKNIIQFALKIPQSIKESNKNSIIKNATIIFKIKNKKYFVEITINKQGEKLTSPSKPFKDEGTLSIPEKKYLIHQISVESVKKTTNKALLTISDIETGEFYKDGYLSF